MNHQFYLTLPSDSSGNIFPDNTTACFKTKLSDRIELEGQYEVGLAQLIYPRSWYNFNNKDRSLSITYQPNYNQDEGKHMPEMSVVFVSGQFANEKTMAMVLTDWIQLTNVILAWDPWERKMKLTIIRDEGVFNMSRALADMLGFDSAGPYRKGIFPANRTFDINANLRMIYVYSDIVSYSSVGDTKVPLLRVIDTQGSYGQMVSTTFTHPHYVPLARNDLETIDIHINQELGRSVPFEFGKAVVTLHFRRQNKLI
jgi:hypothetical protein